MYIENLFQNTSILSRGARRQLIEEITGEIPIGTDEFLFEILEIKCPGLNDIIIDESVKFLSGKEYEEVRARILSGSDSEADKIKDAIRSVSEIAQTKYKAEIFRRVQEHEDNKRVSASLNNGSECLIVAGLLACVSYGLARLALI